MKKSLVIVIFLFLLINLNIFVEGELIREKINREESFSYKENKTNFEISIYRLDSKGVKLEINENKTGYLNEGDIIKLNNSHFPLEVLNVSYDPDDFKKGDIEIIIGDYIKENKELHENKTLVIDNDFGFYSIFIEYIIDGEPVISINGKSTNYLMENNLLKLEDRNYFEVKEILHDEKNPENSRINFQMIIDRNVTKFSERGVCLETDEGRDIAKKGLTLINTTRVEDSCSGEKVLEYYCVYDIKTDIHSLKNEDINCLEGYFCSDGKCIKKEVIEEINSSNVTEEISLEINNSCEGCLTEGICYDEGYRNSSIYCGVNGSFIDQLKGSSQCGYDYECESNVCSLNQCINRGLFAGIVKFFRWIF